MSSLQAMTPAHRELVEQAEADAATWHALHKSPPTSAELLAAAVRELSGQVERLSRLGDVIDMPCATVPEAVRIIEQLVDMTDPNDKIGGALTIIVEALTAARQAGLEALELLDERAQCTAPSWRETTDRIAALRSVLEGK